MSPEPRPAGPSAAHANASADAPCWEALMLRAQDGDQVAYHALLRSVVPYLRAIVHRYLGRGEDAEDALQEILLTVHGIRHTYERGRPFKPWLSTIASRRCIDLLRRRAQRMRHEVEAPDAAGEPASDGHGPSTTAERHHDARHLHQVVDMLPERQREAVRLLHLQELSLDEAAAHSTQSVGALKVACHRALKSLRRALSTGDHRHD